LKAGGRRVQLVTQQILAMGQTDNRQQPCAGLDAEQHHHTELQPTVVGSRKTSCTGTLPITIS
jgi:hypothetical protein